MALNRLFCRRIFMFVCVLALSATSSQAFAAETVLDGIIVQVNGKIITQYELEDRMLPVYEQIQGRKLNAEESRQVAELRTRFLKQMIDDILILQDAERYKLKVTDVEVEEQIKKFRETRKISDEDFLKNLKLQHMTRDDFVRNMRRDIIKHRLIASVVSSKVVVTDSEVEARYNERKAEFFKDSQVQLALILLPPGMSAAEMKTTIESGQMTFAQAADKYSRGPGVGSGGDIGFLGWKDLAPEWNDAVAGLKPGQIGKPVRIQDTEALLQVVSVKAGEEVPLDSVREQIFQSLHEGKFDKVFQDYMEKLRDKAVIEYRNL
jgi:peptidyl-prolyl cis-trans isomerase SurA